MGTLATLVIALVIIAAFFIVCIVIAFNSEND